MVTYRPLQSYIARREWGGVRYGGNNIRAVYVAHMVDSRCPGKFVAVRPCLHKMYQNVTQAGHIIHARHVGDDFVQIIMFLDMHYILC